MVWDVVGHIASVLTILAFPASAFGLYEIVYKVVPRYDAFVENNEAGGETLFICNSSKKDFKIGKKHNPDRRYHIKGRCFDDKDAWR